MSYKSGVLKDKFIHKAKMLYGDRYDYSKVVYVNNRTKVCIICPVHGEFFQTACNHLKGHGCPSCSGMERWSRNKLIREGIEKYGYKYDYSKSEVKTGKYKVEIKCNDCGTVFFQSPHDHICGLKGGCPTCRYKYVSDKKKIDFYEFKRRAELKHNKKYTYDQSSYINLRHKVRIFCQEHGWFEQDAVSHLQGYGCRACSNERLKEKFLHTQEWFLEEARRVHGNRYNYDLCTYSGLDKKVTIVCNKHGKFEQLAGNHLHGKGCPCCKNSIGEEKISVYLSNNNIDNVRQYRITLTKHKTKKEGIFVDFYLPSKNAIIEFNGEQHYRPVENWGGDNAFKKQQERDLTLKKYCKDNKIKFIEIPYSEINNIDEILSKELNIGNIK